MAPKPTYVRLLGSRSNANVRPCYNRCKQGCPAGGRKQDEPFEAVGWIRVLKAAAAAFEEVWLG